MDQIFHRVLQFERFELDLTRGYLRVGGRDVELPPKPFEVLRHLAENAGRLVSKEKLFEAVWPNVTVTDDSLVQCIRELRNKLGDGDHSLIKTVSRRGYLLDATPSTPAPIDLAAKSPDVPGQNGTRKNGLIAQGVLDRKRTIQPLVLSFLCLASVATALFMLLGGPDPKQAVDAVVKPATLPPSARNELFNESAAKRVAAIAHSKHLPLPSFQVDALDDDVPLDIRQFVGIWVSNKGFVHTNRQFMLMVTHVEKQGLAGGYTVRGPPSPNSRIQNPAEAVPFTAFISDGALTYRNRRGDYKVWFVGEALVFKQTYVSGDMTMVALDPAWTLVEAERLAASRPLGR